MNQSYSLATLNAVKHYLAEASARVGDFNNGWRPQGDITSATGVTGVVMRRMASDHPQTFLGSSKGYKLVRSASLEEVNDNIRTLLSRSEKIMHRARSLQRYSLERSKAVSRLAQTTAAVS